MARMNSKVRREFDAAADVTLRDADDGAETATASETGVSLNLLTDAYWDNDEQPNGVIMVSVFNQLIGEGLTPADAVREGFKLRHGFRPRIPGVDHHVQPQLSRDFQLLIKHGDLADPDPLIVGRSSSRDPRRQAMKIEAAFADGHHLGMGGQ